MSNLLACACAVVLLFVILYAIGMNLKRRLSPSLTALSYVPAVSLLLVLVQPAPAGPDTLWAYMPVYLMLFLPVYFLYAGTVPQKLFVFLSQLFAGLFVYHISSQASRLFFAPPGNAYNALHLGMLCVLGGLYLYWLKAGRRKLDWERLSRGGGWVWAVYAFGPCLGCALLPVVLWSGTYHTPLLTALLLLFVLWSAAVLIFGILATLAKSQAVLDLELARRILDAGASQSAEFANMVETARILRHDCKHHLHAAQMLLETGRVQEAREYLLAFGTKCDAGAFPVFCLNPAVNALLIGYQQRSRKEGIDFSAAVELPEKPPMDRFELCSLLGNLMENALEACRVAPEGRRRITLKGAPQDGRLLICVKNTFDGTILKEEGHIVSRKGVSGGLGIKSIRAIAGRHRGEYVPQWDEHTFTASVMLRL